MANARGKMAFCFLLLAACGSLLMTAGCFPRLTVDRSAPPIIDLQDYQPVAILPPADAPGFASSASLLMTASQEVLKTKNFSITPLERGVQALQEMNQSAQAIPRNAALLRRFGEILRSRIIFAATFVEYRRQESYFSSSTSQVWQGAAYEYQSLPTYHQGVCEMKVSLKMLDAEKGTVVFAAEGTGRGPTRSQERVLRRLVAHLMKDLPILPAKQE